MRNKVHKVDFCIVGGGMAGTLAAISAARHGVSVALIQDRPVLGGNASSEIRMCIGGAHGANNRETGILEEILMENLYRNSNTSYSIWDSILYEKVKGEENITLILNATCTELKMNSNRIESVRAWQLTTETWHEVTASYFADCSGDSVLAPLCNAEFRIGREARYEFNESIAPEVEDKKTMGMSCLMQLRETSKPQKYIPPSWANKYPSDKDIPHREHDLYTNFWWIELGGMGDTVHDAEELRDDLLKITFGVWDHMKNYGNHGVDNWVLDWVGFLPGKRESRRYVGDHILTQNDIRAEGKFNDLIAYGGWSMDDHFPEGFNYRGGYPTIFHEAPSPYGIPYRCVYSKNIENLFFAGRNISTTHTALSSTRVMATCAMLGQAVGTAAAIAIKDNLTPREVYENKIKELKQLLMEDDCYLPWNKREISELTRKANIVVQKGQGENLRNGYDRQIGDCDNGWTGNVGDAIEYRFDNKESIKELRFVFDSNLNRKINNMPSHYFLNESRYHVPETMIKDLKVEILNEDNKWVENIYLKNNYNRLVKLSVDLNTKGVRVTPMDTWGSEVAHIFSFDCN